MVADNSTIQKRLRFKTVSTIIVGLVLTIFIGLILYLLPIFAGYNVTFFIIGFLIFAVGLPTCYFIRIPNFFVVNIFVIPLSPLVTVLLNNISIKHVFQPTIQSYLLTMGFILFAIFFLVWLLLVGITRIFIGYEMQYQPVVYSYIFDGRMDKDSLKKLKKLVRLVGAMSTSILKGKGYSVFRFFYKKDGYLAYLRQKGNQKTEMDFVVFKVSRDTIIQPKNENVEIFFSLFEAVAKKLNEQGKTAKIERESMPEFSKNASNELVSLYESPFKFRFPISRPSLSAIRNWSGQHTVLIGFIGGIVAAIIAGLILRYVSGV